jgi:hypothetical protein
MQHTTILGGISILSNSLYFGDHLDMQSSKLLERRWALIREWLYQWCAPLLMAGTTLKKMIKRCN